MPIETIRRVVLACLMAALTAVGSYLSVPIGPVPIVLTNLFVLLSGLLLGGGWGLGSVGIYLLLGVMGFPVFAGAKGGLAHVLGPTGGYLLGYALSAWIAGLISERGHRRLLWDIPAVFLGCLAIYLPGIPWLKGVTGVSWSKALMIGFFPFVIGDVVKASVALFLARAVRPVLDRQFQSFPVRGRG